MNDVLNCSFQNGKLRQAMDFLGLLTQDSFMYLTFTSEVLSHSGDAPFATLSVFYILSSMDLRFSYLIFPGYNYAIFEGEQLT